MPAWGLHPVWLWGSSRQHRLDVGQGADQGDACRGNVRGRLAPDDLRGADAQRRRLRAEPRVVIHEQGGLGAHPQGLQRPLENPRRRLGRPDLTGQDQGIGSSRVCAVKSQVTIVPKVSSRRASTWATRSA